MLCVVNYISHQRSVLDNSCCRSTRVFLDQDHKKNKRKLMNWSHRMQSVHKYRCNDVFVISSGLSHSHGVGGEQRRVRSPHRDGGCRFRLIVLHRWTEMLIWGNCCLAGMTDISSICWLMFESTNVSQTSLLLMPKIKHPPHIHSDNLQWITASELLFRMFKQEYFE